MLKRLALLSIIFVLSACRAPRSAVPQPTPEAIMVYYPSSLQPWADRLAGCAADFSTVALYFTQSADLSIELNPNDIMLMIGQPPKNINSRHIFQVGWEQVVVIVNQQNPIAKLSTIELTQIFTGQMLAWESGVASAIQIWVLPDEEPVQRIFDAALALSQPLAPDAFLAPGSMAMLEAVATNENAVGYLPQSFLSLSGSPNVEKVKSIQLEGPLVNRLHQPVLAYTKTEPAGYERDLLVCMQTAGN